MAPSLLQVHLTVPPAHAVKRVHAALAREGFTVLSEVDLAQALQRKLGVDFRPYVILDACHPGLMYQGLSIEPALGLVMPGHIVLYETDDGRGTLVRAVDPRELLRLTPAPALEPVAAQLHDRLVRVVAALAA